MRLAVTGSTAAALAALVAVAVSAPAVARAQAGEDTARAEAEAHFRTGETHYNLAEYDDAIREFKVAYELSKEPLLLFNLAQAYRLKGDCGQAVRFYRTYLRLAPADGQNRPAAEQLLATLGDCSTRSGKPEPTPLPPVPERSKRFRPPAWSPWVALGVAAVAAGVGAYYGLQTLDRDVTPDDAASAAGRANLSFITAGVAGAGAAGLFLWRF